MNYNFNSQFPFPWSSGNPYLSNGFPGSNNAAMQPINPSGTQPPFSLQHAAGQAQAQGYNCSGIIGPGVRFLTGLYPFGINGSFPTTNSYPANWNFSYNAIQSPTEPPNQVQSPATVAVQSVPVVQSTGPVQPVQMPQNLPPV